MLFRSDVTTDNYFISLHTRDDGQLVHHDAVPPERGYATHWVPTEFDVYPQADDGWWGVDSIAQDRSALEGQGRIAERDRENLGASHEQVLHNREMSLLRKDVPVDAAIDDLASLRPDLRAVVYALGVAGRETSRFRDLWRLYLRVESAEEKTRILRALGSAGSIVLRRDALGYSLSGHVRKQDAFMVLNYLKSRAIVVDRTVGLCLLCHAAPIPEERFQGNLGPDLAGVGARLTPAQLRARLVDPRASNPASIMPAALRTEIGRAHV